MRRLKAIEFPLTSSSYINAGKVEVSPEGGLYIDVHGNAIAVLHGEGADARFLRAMAARQGYTLVKKPRTR